MRLRPCPLANGPRAGSTAKDILATSTGDWPVSRLQEHCSQQLSKCPAWLGFHLRIAGFLLEPDVPTESLLPVDYSQIIFASGKFETSYLIISYDLRILTRKCLGFS